MSYRLMRTGVGVLVVVAALLVAPTVGADLKVTGSVVEQRVGAQSLATADTPVDLFSQVSHENGTLDLMQAEPGGDRVLLSHNVNPDLFHLTTPSSLPVRQDTRLASGPFGIKTVASADTTRESGEQLIGQVDVAIVGLPNDLNSARMQTVAGPRVLRTLNTRGTQDVYSLLHPLEVLSVVDYGDFVVAGTGPQQAIDEVATMVQEKANSGAVPILVSGERSVLYPGVTGVARAHTEEIGLLSFSARADLGGPADQTSRDPGTIARLVTEGVVAGENLIQVGLRESLVDEGALGWLKAQGARYHTMAEISSRGFPRVLKKVMKAVKSGPDKLFVAIDVSMFEPTDTHVGAGGLSVREITAALRSVCATSEVIGVEITDARSEPHASRRSSPATNAVLNACLVGIAVRESGLSPEFVQPLAQGY